LYVGAINPVGHEPGKFVFVVDAHRPAEGNHHIDTGSVGQARGLEEPGVGDHGIQLRELGRDAAEAFERNMLQDVGVHPVDSAGHGERYGQRLRI